MDPNPDSERKDAMLTETTISDGRNILLDLEPMNPDQQKQLVTAVADLLIRSSQIVPDIALSAPNLLQFLSEAADMAKEQSTPVDPEDVTVFGVGALETHVTVPDNLLTRREIDGAFDEGCAAIRVVNDAAIENPELASAIATLLNRAYWLGQGRCAPFHVTPRN
jgi:hypothetical protein